MQIDSVPSILEWCKDIRSQQACTADLIIFLIMSFMTKVLMTGKKINKNEHT